MRIVIRDADRTISFLGDTQLVDALVAACATDPSTGEALLLAAEPYVPGIAAQVTEEMMGFDLWMRGGATKVRLLRPEPGIEPMVPVSFEVVDPLTRQLAYIPDSEGVVIIDLETRDIFAPVSHVELPGRRGSVVRPDLTGECDVETVYTLGSAWTLPDTSVVAMSGAFGG